MVRNKLLSEIEYVCFNVTHFFFGNIFINIRKSFVFGMVAKYGGFAETIKKRYKKAKLRFGAYMDVCLHGHMLFILTLVA